MGEIGERKIYLLLSNTGTLLSRLIKFYTKKPYSHASIAFDIELTEVYSFGRKNPRNPFIGGFVAEDIHSELFIQADCAIYSLSVTKKQVDEMKWFIQKIESMKEQYHYNFLGLFGVIMNKPLKREYAFFCSQFVASVLKYGELARFEKDVSLIQPHDLPFTAKFQLIYEGQLKDFQETFQDEKVTFPYSFYSI